MCLKINNVGSRTSFRTQSRGFNPDLLPDALASRKFGPFLKLKETAQDDILCRCCQGGIAALEK